MAMDNANQGPNHLALLDEFQEYHFLDHLLCSRIHHIFYIFIVAAIFNLLETPRA